MLLGTDEGVSRFDIVEAHYWWNHHHGADRGEGLKNLIEAGRIGEYFRPSMGAEVETEAAQCVYDELCRARGCAHEQNIWTTEDR